MKAKGMIFAGWGVRAILAGTKTQTRRVVKPQPVFRDGLWWHEWSQYESLGAADPQSNPGAWRCPHPVDSLIYVRETWSDSLSPVISYKVDDEFEPVVSIWKRRWRSPLFMPRAAARIVLRVTDVRVQRLQESRNTDAVAEGFPDQYYEGQALQRFADAWDALNAKRGYGWDSNPWVWAYTFTPVATDHASAQQMLAEAVTPKGERDVAV